MPLSNIYDIIFGEINKGMILKYKADVSLLTTWIDSKRIEPYPLMAVFEFDNKHLMYVGTNHNSVAHPAPASFDAINYAFAKFNIDCVVTEMEHTYNWPDALIGKPGLSELAYSVYIAENKKIPYFFADTNLADWIQDFEKKSHHKAVILQTMWVLNDARGYKKYKKQNDTIKHAFGNVKWKLSQIGFDMPLTIEEFKKCVKNDFGFDVSDENISDILNMIPNWNEPNINGGITNKIWAETGLYSRNPYMLKEIFKAVNKHNNVLVTMGAGHYEEQRLVLEKAFGKPKYIHKFPKSKRIDME